MLQLWMIDCATDVALSSETLAKFRPDLGNGSDCNNYYCPYRALISKSFSVVQRLSLYTVFKVGHQTERGA